MFETLREVHATGLLSANGLLGAGRSVVADGPSPMVLLSTNAALHPDRPALADDSETLTYSQLLKQSESLAKHLHHEIGVHYGGKAAIVCRDHVSAVKAIFALSRLGAHIVFVNPEMSGDQIQALGHRQRFDFYVYDKEITAKLDGLTTGANSLVADSIETVLGKNSGQGSQGHKLNRAGALTKAGAGAIVVMTGGTTGVPKSAARKTSATAFLAPLNALLTRAHLARYSSVYVATPICHGFGLSSLFVGLTFGATTYLTRRFNAEHACRLIQANQIEVVSVVPLMLQRMLHHDPAALVSLKCIITGGGVLSPALAQETLDTLGPVLFNTYGTSEAGFSVMAGPESLAQKPDSIGRAIPGVKIKLVNEKQETVPAGQTGELLARGSLSIGGDWVHTGDNAYQDSDGNLFLRGRVDDMIVSGAENVYPLDVENILVQHDEIESVAIVGIPDDEFGQRLKATVVRRSGSDLDSGSLTEWLRPRVARFQMPARIEFLDELPLTSLGKVDRKALRVDPRS